MCEIVRNNFVPWLGARRLEVTFSPLPEFPARPNQCAIVIIHSPTNRGDGRNMDFELAYDLEVEPDKEVVFVLSHDRNRKVRGFGHGIQSQR